MSLEEERRCKDELMVRNCKKDCPALEKLSTYSIFTTTLFLQPLINAHLSLYIMVSFIAEKMFIGGEII